MKKICLILMVVACGCRPPAVRPVRSEDAIVPRPKPGQVISKLEARPPKEVAVPPVPRNPGPNPIPVVPRRDPGPVITETNGELQDVFFEYARAEMRPGGLAALQNNAALLIPLLRDFTDLTVIIEGHCDERGSAEYNLGLGDHRAARTAEMLRGLGVPAANIRTVSYGKEKPQCTDATESCWQKNRRAHVLLQANTPTLP